MPVYLVTNKRTHARAVIIADTSERAKRIRPDDRATWNESLSHWQAPRRGRFGGSTMTAADPLECWPSDLSLVHADEISQQVTNPGFRGSWPVGLVLCFDPDPSPRQVGEGPDDSWGQLR